MKVTIYGACCLLAGAYVGSTNDWTPAILVGFAVGVFGSLIENYLKSGVDNE